MSSSSSTMKHKSVLTSNDRQTIKWAGRTDLGDEAAVEADDERIVRERENVSLGEDLFHLIAKYQMMFQKSLHRKQMSRLFVAD